MSDQGYSFGAANPRVAEALRQLSLILHGKEAVLIRLLACVFAGGHLLLEDLPGLGKTTRCSRLSTAIRSKHRDSF